MGGSFDSELAWKHLKLWVEDNIKSYESGGLCSVAESVHTSNALKMLHKKMCDLESTNTPAYWISYGRDEKYNRYYKCSRCMHEIVIDTEVERYVGLPDTCEVCGATMRK